MELWRKRNMKFGKSVTGSIEYVLTKLAREYLTYKLYKEPKMEFWDWFTKYSIASINNVGYVKNNKIAYSACFDYSFFETMKLDKIIRQRELILDNVKVMGKYYETDSIYVDHMFFDDKSRYSINSKTGELEYYVCVKEDPDDDYYDEYELSEDIPKKVYEEVEELLKKYKESSEPTRIVYENIMDWVISDEEVSNFLNQYDIDKKLENLEYWKK